jgi:hypothetical protein
MRDTNSIIVSLVNPESRKNLGEFKVSFGYNDFYWVNKEEAYHLLYELETAIHLLSEEDLDG